MISPRDALDAERRGCLTCDAKAPYVPGARHCVFHAGVLYGIELAERAELERVTALRALHRSVPCDCDYPVPSRDNHAPRCEECQSHVPCETLELFAVVAPSVTVG